MSEPTPELPKQWIKGLVPTMNDKGFMFEVLDEYADEFIRSSSTPDNEMLDIGCAYGVATIPALRKGARITACDMDRRHLDILKSRAPEDMHDRLTLFTGALPDIDLQDNYYNAILCSRVLHFLSGDEIDASIRNMFRWLKPGGHLYLVADTPWGIWRNFIPTWEKNVANHERWPGHMPKPINFLPYKPSSDDVGPPLMNLLDPTLLRRTCEEAGFIVDKASFVDRSDFGDKGRMDGRENCGLAAHKPD
ncbi:MAG: class I SAM-dependent methyltransferase [Gammaproteobacteria bacterium]|nr:class I SAM-dependent methyltransferase [Gammaproteobacteria bacterium]MCP4089496.1 class I SAM-dependent methyltransferase [Gammaproteobacteria bacterium]MCP4276202.1 class I SAM-dependent methyltransferase [Gammaproteobacteria bacterium]MCP4832899.1 class I SAM-dependent methyltransferase [Gammaproteobacteria bacterium]MCP4930024.1 class I SAM-dependent methyltransferase [Gammaproteobacteria bacterium]